VQRTGRTDRRFSQNLQKRPKRANRSLGKQWNCTAGRTANRVGPSIRGQAPRRKGFTRGTRAIARSQSPYRLRLWNIRTSGDIWWRQWWDVFATPKLVFSLAVHSSAPLYSPFTRC